MALLRISDGVRPLFRFNGLSQLSMKLISLIREMSHAKQKTTRYAGGKEVLIAQNHLSDKIRVVQATLLRRKVI